jgi:DNA-binding GntR family transcriptional regulator
MAAREPVYSSSLDAGSKPTLANLAHQRMRRQILDLELPPGAVVSERVLAEGLAMGKAPVRSALIRLAEDGLVQIAARQGIVISAPSIQDIIELYQMRVPLELLIVRQLAGKLNLDQIARLRANLAAYASVVQARDPRESVDLDFQFHRLLYEFHGNRQMARVLDRILDLLYREIRLAASQFPDRGRDGALEHQAVAEAIIAGDAQRAETLLRDHLRFGEQFVLSRGSAAHGCRNRSE